MTAGNVRKLIARLGRDAGYPSPCTHTSCATPAAMRSRVPVTTPEPFSTGLGHRNIVHTARYTELAPERFRGFWRD
jgi:hypothetical protein